MPAPHAVHALAPPAAAEYWPGAQPAQAVDSMDPVAAAYMPPAQLLQAAAPGVDWYWPEGQPTQPAAPVDDWNCPGSQFAHALATDGAKVPAAQLTQLDAPAAPLCALYVPAEQPVQLWMLSMR